MTTALPAAVHLPGLPYLPRTLTHGNLQVRDGVESPRTPAPRLPLVLDHPEGDPGGVVPLGDADGADDGADGGVAVRATDREGRRYTIRFPASGDADADPGAAWRAWRSAREDLGPHVTQAVALVAIDRWDGAGEPVPALVEEHLAGPGLQQLLDVGYELPAGALENVARGVLTGLRATEARGLGARDVRPSTVVLAGPDPARDPAVLTGRASAEPGGAGGTDRAVATLAYAAPEAQLDDRGRMAAGSAVFSAGVTLLRLHRGGGAAFAVDTAGRAGPDRTGAAVLPTLEGRPVLDDPPLPPRLRAVLAGMLVKNPEERPDAATLLDVLDGRADPDPAWDPDRPYRRPPGPRPDHAYDLSNLPPGRPGPVDVAGDPRPLRGDGRDRAGDVEPLTLIDPPAAGPGRPSILMRIAGIDATHVTEPGERMLFAGTGLALLAYTAYALVGTTAFAWIDGLQAWWLALIAGAIVATIAVTYDRSLLGYVPVDLRDIHDPARDETALRPASAGLVTKILVRVLIAILFAFVVGEPVNLIVFGKDIAAQQAREHRTDQDTLDRTYQARLRGLQAQAAGYEKKDTQASELGDHYRALATAERRGHGATGASGCGPRCRTLIDRADAADAAYPAVHRRYATLLSANEAAQRALRRTADGDRGTLRAQQDADTGFLARETALIHFVASSGPIVQLRYGAVVLFLFVLEMAAVLAKLFSLGGPYERAVARNVRLAERNRVRRAALLDARNLGRYDRIRWHEERLDAHWQERAGAALDPGAEDPGGTPATRAEPDPYPDQEAPTAPVPAHRTPFA